MLATILLKHGMALHESGHVRLGWSPKCKIRHEIVLDSNGDAVRVIHHREADAPTKHHSVAYYGSCFSDYHCGKTGQHLLVIQVGDLMDEEAEHHEIFVRHLCEMESYANPYLHSVKMFMEKEEYQKIQWEEVGLKEAVCFGFEFNGEYVSLLDLNCVQHVTERYLIDQIREKSVMTARWSRQVLLRWEIMLDGHGKVLDVVQYSPKNEKKINLPEFFWGVDPNDCVANPEIIDDLLRWRTRDLCDERKRLEAANELKKIAENVEDGGHLDAIVNCLNNWPRKLNELRDDEDSEVGFAFLVDDVRCNAFEMPVVRQAIERFFMDGSALAGACDITGNNDGRYLTGHSQVFRLFDKQPRIVTRKVYDLYYGGMSERRLTTSAISPKTELYIAAAAAHVQEWAVNIWKDSKKRMLFYIGETGGKKPLMVLGDITHFTGMKYEDLTEQKWKDYKESFVKTYDKTELFVLCIGQVNQGRISTYKAEVYTIRQSNLIINNLLKWFDMTTAWIKEVPFCFPTVTAITKKTGNKLAVLEFWEAMVRGDWLWITERMLVPYLREISEHGKHHYFVKGMGRLMTDLYSNSTDDTTDYLSGKLLAMAHLLENRVRYLNDSDTGKPTMAQCKMDEFRRNPFVTWLAIKNRMHVWERSKDECIRELCKTMKILETDLMAKGFRNAMRLSPEMYVGYDVQDQEYWDWMSARKMERVGNVILESEDTEND